MGKFIDLTGQKFAKLIVMKRVESDKRGGAAWLCKCECGNETIVLSNSLRRGNTKSCGCLLKEKAIIQGKTRRKDLAGKKFGRLTVAEYTGDSKSGSPIWRCLCECGNEINVKAGNLRSGNTKSCGCLSSDNTQKTLDYVKKNRLYDGTFIDTLTSKISRANASGFKGVSKVNKSGKWRAQITLRKQVFYLGEFHNKEDAVKIREQAEEELFQPIIEKFNNVKGEQAT